MMAGQTSKGIEMYAENTWAESGDFLFVTGQERSAVIGTLLVEGGLRFAHAESGGQALELLDTEPWKVLVADAILPDMDGIELTRAALEKHAGLLVILGVTDPPEDFGKKAAMAGVAGIVYTPYKPDKLFPLLWFLMQ